MALSTLQRIAGSIGLDVSAPKTKWMWLEPLNQSTGESPDSETFALSLNGVTIRQVESFNFLGSMISADGGCSLEIQTRVEAAERKLLELSWIFELVKVRRRRVIRLVTTHIWPILLYGCEAWTMVNRDYEVIEAFLNKVRLRILRRFRMVDGASITNAELHALVQLPSAACLVVGRQMKFVLKLMMGKSSEIARRMLFAEIKDPEGLVGGRGRRVYPRSQMANLVYFSKVVAANDSLVNLVRKASPDLAEAIMDLIVSISDTSINRVWQALVEMDSFAADEPSPEQSGADVQPLGCRLVSAVMKVEAKATQTTGAPSALFGSEVPPQFFCQQCSAGFIERKALLRHERMAHQPPLLEPDEVRRTEPGSVSQLHCSWCNMSYRTLGWLSRHIKEKHPDKVPPVITNPEPRTGTLTGPRGEHSGQSSSGRTCPICGKGGKLKEWSEKTLKNHVAKEHRVNLATGEASRMRKSKSGGTTVATDSSTGAVHMARVAMKNSNRRRAIPARVDTDRDGLGVA